ncbi:MAG TPA: hypothetical protein VK969_12375 [Acidimicrobiia bacterium]|nr:hypothetical protein [Acidimicrobiia bacterium]
MLFASATPIVPGRISRYRGLAGELEPHLGAYEALNAEYGVARHSYWISHARDGSDIGVSMYDISPEGLTAMRQREWDPASPHDVWWLEFVRDVNGVDMREQTPHREPPESVFSWER